MTVASSDIPLGLQLLLDEFEDVFRLPKGLHPHRMHDHCIPLLDKSMVVKIKPYRYPPYQKAEIEKLVKEMLEPSIIRDSTSPFASPIVMVQKMGVGGYALTISSLTS